MTAKDYLLSIQYERKQIDRLKKRKDGLKLNYSGISGIDYTRDRVQSNPTNALENAAWDLLERIERIDNEIIDMVLDIENKLDEIQGMENPNYSEILYRCYAEGKSLKEVSIELECDYNNLTRIHKKALQAFESKYLISA